MAPFRRYLRITKYSVLEVRIYLEKPSDAPWLLSSRDPVLPRIIEEIRPLVLPKLREENENAKKKGGKKKRGIKDVASRDDFEVSVHLTDLSTRHSLLTKQKQFTSKPKLKSTGNKLNKWLNNSENPIHVQDDDEPPGILQEDGDSIPNLADIPEAKTGTKRKSDEAEDALFVSSSDEEIFTTQRPSTSKRRRQQRGKSAVAGPIEADEDEEEEVDDKKKLALSTSYDGFSIYGRILCLVVKRKGTQTAAASGATMGGSQMMEQWVSTQAAQEGGLEEDEDG